MGGSKKKYDVVVIGGGPAGLSAGIYTSRARLSTLLIEKGMVGGQIVNAEQVENYPGFSEGISGFDLTQSMHRQATKFGMETLNADVIGIGVNGEQKVVKTAQGDFVARALIIAGGSERQKLDIPGEAEFTGKGVSYCATCDGAFFREKPVAVVGGGDAALTEALHLTRFASKVTVIHRRHELRATRILQEKALAEPKIELLWDTTVEEVAGGNFVDRITVSHVTGGEKAVIDIAGVFVSIGFKPNTDYLKSILTLDKTGAIVVDENMATVVPGIFAAGDIRSNSIRQVISAAGDGAIAAVSAGKYIGE
ncbi:MAG: thioredoxin-disulfide reductase [Chloroflexi bacterium RBG_16_50_9]|nr:MAG: thioredoxin-disulfide reductase [Chloroflexi bacterium RBG_16_50_9]